MTITNLVSDDTQGTLGPTQSKVVEKLNEIIDQSNVTESAVGDGGALPYNPGAPPDWVAPPATVGEALDRIAAAVVALSGGPIP